MERWPGKEAPGRAEAREVRELLRAHLAAGAHRRHLARHCLVCHRLLRLAGAKTSGAK